MLLAEVAKTLSLKPESNASAEVDVTSGYASDLLSDVLAKAKNGTLWVTNQKHQNVVGVAVMLNLSGVIIAGGIEPDANTLEKAAEESLPLYTTAETLYEVVGRMYELGIRSC